ncbi:MAG: hypothetical protein ACYCU7_06600 [Acidimicrobiales bacterium]
MSTEFESELRRSLRRAAGEAGSTATLCSELARWDFRPRRPRRPLCRIGLPIAGGLIGVAVLLLVLR